MGSLPASPKPELRRMLDQHPFVRRMDGADDEAIRPAADAPDDVSLHMRSLPRVNMKVLVACEMSGIVRDAFAMRGHDAWSCDVLPSLRGNRRHIRRDVRDILSDGWDLMVAHPPCTYLSYAAACRVELWNSDHRRAKRQEAMEFFCFLLTAPIPLIAIENPHGVPRVIFAPSQTIQPFQFGDKWSKRTLLWLRGLPLLSCTEIVRPTHSLVTSGNALSRRKGLPSLPSLTGGLSGDRRVIERSKTSPGIALAMAQQWG